MFPAARLKTYEGVRIMLSCDSNLHKSWWRDHEMLTCSCGQNLLKTDSLLKASTWFGADAQRLFVPTSTAAKMFVHFHLSWVSCMFVFVFLCCSVCTCLFYLQVAAAFGLCGRPWVFAKARKTRFGERFFVYSCQNELSRDTFWSWQKCKEPAKHVKQLG